MGDLIKAAAKSNLQNGQGRKTKQFLRRFQARLDQHIAKGLSATFAHEMRSPVFTDGELAGKIAQTNWVGLISLDIAADHGPSLDQTVIYLLLHGMPMGREPSLSGPSAEPGCQLQ